MHKYQKTKDKLSSSLEKDYDSTVSKSPMDVETTNPFQMDILIIGPPIACKQYPVPLKYQKFVDEDIWLLKNVGCIS